MKTLEQKTIEIEQIPTLIEESGITGILGVRLKISQTRQGARRLEVTGPAKTIFLDDKNGLESVCSGDARILVDQLSGVATAIKGNMDAPTLLKDARFKRACLGESCLADLETNCLMGELVELPTKSVPVFYGSTSGINFAEILETALCSKAIQDQGLESSVVFDFDGLASEESNRIFAQSMADLPTLLREKTLNFSQNFEGGLIGGRLKASKELLSRIDGLPEVNFVDGLDVFKTLKERFTLGQLLVLSRIAGNDPGLFMKNGETLTRTSLLSFDLFNKSIGAIIEEGCKPAGFTYYARDAIIGPLGGAMGFPFKLTEAANIYKVMASTSALFDPETKRGILLLPITRFRIQKGILGRPIDPIALMMLADDQTEAFVSLIRDFRQEFKVLSPEEVIQKGAADRKFLIEKYFNLGGDNE